MDKDLLPRLRQDVIERLFLLGDARLIGSFHTVNNGYDYRATSEEAELISDVFMTTAKSDQS